LFLQTCVSEIKYGKNEIDRHGLHAGICQWPRGQTCISKEAELNYICIQGCLNLIALGNWRRTFWYYFMHFMFQECVSRPCQIKMRYEFVQVSNVMIQCKVRSERKDCILHNILVSLCMSLFS